MVYKRNKNSSGYKYSKKLKKVKNRKKDLDQIEINLESDCVKALINQPIDNDKPGAAQHYCLYCDRYFINQTALSDHLRTKLHKKRLVALEWNPYSIEDSEKASGKGSFNYPQKRDIESLTMHTILRIKKSD